MSIHRSIRFLTLLLTIIGFVGLSRPAVTQRSGTTEAPQAAPSMSIEYAQPGVVVLALGSVDREEQEFRDALSEMLELTTRRDAIMELQMTIARKAAEFGPVLLLVADPETHAYVTGTCSRYNLCLFLEQGQIRISIVPHEGPWIRDYGPQFGTTADGRAVVMDARYHDRDSDADLHEQRTMINRVRRELLEKLLASNRSSEDVQGLFGTQDDKEGEPFLDPLLSTEELPIDPGSVEPDQGDDEDLSAPAEGDSENMVTDEEEGAPEDDFGDLEEWLRENAEPEQRDSDHNEISWQLSLLRDLAEVYGDGEIIQRSRDDDSPYGLSEAVLSNPKFSLYRPPISLDGGNIVRFANDECITTRDLIGRNDGLEETVSSTLAKYYSCKKTLYLSPLPGPVIKHVDMFLLPAGGRKVLLAWYAPEEEPLRSHWGELTSEQKALVFEAAVAMRKNEAELEKNNFEVVRIPALPPAVSELGIYYPTLLNALIRTNAQGRRQVLVPTYEQAPADLQNKALEDIRQAFGPEAQIEPIEATSAAQGQGAIHCLTLTVPYEHSVFADRGEEAIRRELAQSIQALEQEILVSRQYDLQGSWGWENTDDGTDPAPILRIDSSTMTWQSSESEEIGMGYTLWSQNSREWFFTAHSPEEPEDEIEGKVLWTDRDHIELTLGPIPSISLQRRSEPAPEASPVQPIGAADLP